MRGASRWMVVVMVAALIAVIGSSPSMRAQTEGWTAEQVLLALRDAGLPVGEYIVYDENTDPNNQLGRPHGYLSKVNFNDSLLRVIGDQFDTDNGGSIEVFATEVDATARREYIERVTRGVAFLTEYDYQAGTVLLRLSQRIPPSRAALYRDALLALFAAP